MLISMAEVKKKRVKERRDIQELYAEVLISCIYGKGITNTLYAVRTNYHKIKDMVKFLIDIGMLEKREDFYYTTEKGVNYIRIMENARKCLQ